MTEPRLIPPKTSNGKAPSPDGNGAGRAPAPRPFKRKIDCCTGREDEADPAALVGDGYKRAPR